MLTDKNKSILNFSHEVLPGLKEDSVFCPDILKLYEKKKKNCRTKKITSLHSSREHDIIPIHYME